MQGLGELCLHGVLGDAELLGDLAMRKVFEFAEDENFTATRRQGGNRLSQFNVICEMGSTEAVKEAILAGLGISILSIFAVKRELEQGLLIPVDIVECSMERHFYIIYRRNFPLRKHHRLFLEVIKKLSASLTVP